MAPATASRPLHSLLSSLSLRHPALSHTPKSTSTSLRGQIRTQATARRATKRLRVRPSSSAPRPHPAAATHLPAEHQHQQSQSLNSLQAIHQRQMEKQRGNLSAQLAPQKPIDRSASRITFTPPPSAPSPYHTPSIFLPASDPRHASLRASHVAANPYAADPKRPLPPPVRKPYKKAYNITKEQIDEMRVLRTRDPAKWTRAALAEKFGCTPFFVYLAAPSPVDRRMWHRQQQEEAREKWGPRKMKAFEDRVRRRELWSRDA